MAAKQKSRHQQNDKNTAEDTGCRAALDAEKYLQTL